MNLLVLIVMIACIIMVVFTQFSYQRRAEDERKRLEKERDQDSSNPYRNGIINEPEYGTFG
jgi:cell division protein FtsL